MKERIAHIIVKRKLFIAMLFSLTAIICFSYKTYAQGWTFTFQIYASGDCGGIQPPLITVPNLNIPTKSQCESFRQQVLAIKVTGGNCTVGYTCTPCTGSDISTPGQESTSGQISTSGLVNTDGQFLGKPFFTTHQSQAFEDWATGYKQQLASYGITSILGKNITPHQIPLTGNIEFDKFYYSQSATFNPTTLPTPPYNSPNQDASVVDLRGKSDISDKPVPLLRTAEEDNSIKVLPVPLPEPGKIKEDHEYIEFTRDALVTLVGVAPKQYSYLGIAIIDIYAVDAKTLLDCLGGDCPPKSTILTNIASQVATDMAVQGVGDLGGFASGKLFSILADRSMIKKGVLPGIEGVVTEGRIAEIGEAHFAIVSAGADAGKRILNAWGVETVYDDK